MHPVLVDLLFTASTKLRACLWGVLMLARLFKRMRQCSKGRGELTLGDDGKMFHKVKQEPKKLSDRSSLRK